MYGEEKKSVITVGDMVEVARSNAATATQLGGMVEQMGVYLMQLDARLRRQEELLSQKVTISSADSKNLMRLIRERAAFVRLKYALPDEYLPLIRKAIKCDVMRQLAVKDFHDLPEAKLGLAKTTIDTWESYRLVREIRSRAGVME